MPINFEQAAIRQPKIDIIGKEVPLAALEKTGDILQGRFDKSYENYSLADEALKQMEATANPVDREKAKELRSQYTDEMKNILKAGDFHNMRHQTSALARNAAANYKIIGDRNINIQHQLDAISKDPRYRLDPEGAKQHFLKSLNSVNINPETRTVSDFNVDAYGAAADQDIAEKMLRIAPTIRSTFKNAKGSNFKVETLPDGRKVIVNETVGGSKEILSAKDISDNLMGYIGTDPEVQAYISRDVERMGLDPKSKEGQAAYNQLLQERSLKAAQSMGTMYDINKDNTVMQQQVVGDYTPANSGSGFSTDTIPTGLQATQGTVDIDKNIQADIKALDDLTFTNTGAEDQSGWPKAPTVGKAEFARNVPDNNSGLRGIIPAGFYDTMKGKNLSDFRIKEAYKEHLLRKQKVVNSKYTAIDNKEAKQLVGAIERGAAGTRWTDEEGNEVDVSNKDNFDWAGADVAFYPGKGTYSITSGNKTIYPTTIDPKLAQYMGQAKELVDDFTNLNSKHNIVNVPTVSGENIQVHIFKDDIREDGTYTGRIRRVRPVVGEDGKTTYLPESTQVKFDTKKDGYTPAAINTKILHLLNLSVASKS